MNCQQFRQIMDSYIGDELLVETNHDVLRHLENCPPCREELSTRRYLRTKLRSAVINSVDARINPVFARRLEANLRQTALRPTVWEKLKAGTFINSPIFAAAVAACLLFVVLLGANRLRQSPAAPEQASIEQERENKPVENPQPAATNKPSIIKVARREVTREAVGDHENCALHFRLKENPITLDEAAKKFGAFNKDLDKTVKAALRGEVPGGNKSNEENEKIEFLEAHSCVFDGRRFAHVVLRKGKKTVSVLVADTDSFEDADGTIASESVENLQVARFSAGRHDVFVVSDLSEWENAAIAERISPAVNRHIEQARA